VRFLFPVALLLLAGVVPVSAQWARTPVVRPEILAVIFHDTAAFTQGLVWLNGKLYESTGLYGKSSLRELDPVTGAVKRKQALPARYFAEGLTWHRGEFIQITWKEGEALRWPLSPWSADANSRASSAKPSGKYRYAGEGWGLTTLGEDVWMSNGSDTLYRRTTKGNNPFRVTRKIAARYDGKPIDRLNELEAARGMIVANVWYSESLVVIDPRDGRVVAMVDGAELVARSGRRSPDDVLNGVAYDPAKNEFYLTGKNWPKMFRVRIPF
jgi:glutamine cyclotransferase